MPGPGGGSRGGGFRGGGGSSGGFRGGSSGGFRPTGSGGFRTGGFGYRPWGFMPFPWGFGYRRGIGCSTIPILAVFVIFMLIWLFAPSSETYNEDITSGGKTYVYSEEEFQEFADEEYSRFFDDSSCYEGNILLVVLTNDEADDYFALAWVGDQIDPAVREMFGGYTQLGQEMNRFVNGTYYAYSLDADLAAVVEAMSGHVSAATMGMEISDAQGGFRNYTDLSMNEDTVEAALTEFREETGIPMAIVVESIEEVFPRKMAFGSIFGAGTLPVVLILVVVVVALAVRKKKSTQG